MKILYEDNHLFICEKSAGVTMQKTPHSENDVESEAKGFIKKRDQKQGGVFLHAVHRLDKPVSGIAVFAKSQKSLERMNACIRNGLFKKTYFAVVEGLVEESGTLIHYLLHGDHKALISAYPKDGYKKASLNFKRLKVGSESSLVEIELLTGRYHQIRAQFSFIGHPIVYDAKYHSSKEADGERILLHHGRVEFPHPVKNENVVIECNPNFKSFV